jgi:hypothetical protein
MTEQDGVFWWETGIEVQVDIAGYAQRGKFATMSIWIPKNSERGLERSRFGSNQDVVVAICPASLNERLQRRLESWGFWLEQNPRFDKEVYVVSVREEGEEDGRMLLLRASQLLCAKLEDKHLNVSATRSQDSDNLKVPSTRGSIAISMRRSRCPFPRAGRVWDLHRLSTTLEVQECKFIGERTVVPESKRANCVFVERKLHEGSRLMDFAAVSVNLPRHRE